MKFGFRTPSIKKSIKARSTGRIKRAVKKSLNPTYGKKGIGYIKNPEKALKNSLYHKTTVDTTKTIKSAIRKTNENKTELSKETNNQKKEVSAAKVGLALYTGGLSLLFTGIHKKKKDNEK